MQTFAHELDSGKLFPDDTADFSIQTSTLASSFPAILDRAFKGELCDMTGEKSFKWPAAFHVHGICIYVRFSIADAPPLESQ